MGALGLHKEVGQNNLWCGRVYAEASLMINHVNYVNFLFTGVAGRNLAFSGPPSCHAINKQVAFPCRLPRCGEAQLKLLGAECPYLNSSSRGHLGVGVGFREMPWV